jgi:hypothetical protein
MYIAVTYEILGSGAQNDHRGEASELLAEIFSAILRVARDQGKLD